MNWIIAAAIAYVVGSIPFGLMIGLAKGIDIRDHGSKNIGATNTGRVLGRSWGIICFFLDLLKGLAPVMAAGWYFGWLNTTVMTPSDAGKWLAVAIAAIMGHVFSCFLKFKGGKGVATGFGVILGIWPYLTLPAIGALITWVVVVLISKYVSLASIAASLGLPVYFVVVTQFTDGSLSATWPFLAGTGLMAILIVARHINNIQRLLRGEENKISLGKKKDS